MQREADVGPGHGHRAHLHLPALSGANLPHFSLRHPLQPLDDVLAVDGAAGGDPHARKVGAELVVVIGLERCAAVYVDQVGQSLSSLVVFGESGRGESALFVASLCSVEKRHI